MSIRSDIVGSRAPEINGRENIWQFLRRNRLSNAFSNCPMKSEWTASRLKLTGHKCHRTETMRNTRRRSLVPARALLAALTLAGAGDGAFARTPYDGPWNVSITTLRGACNSGVGFGVEIRDGIVYGYGGFDVRGRVSRNGVITVVVSQGDSSASGSGHLSGGSGVGTWRGTGSRRVCSGRWFARRR
jgi:hypothetical protein